jgi:hypothetical protein
MPLRREIIFSSLDRCRLRSQVGISTTPWVIRIAPVIILTIWKGIIHAMRCVDRDLEPRGNGKAETIADGLELFNQSSVSNDLYNFHSLVEFQETQEAQEMKRDGEQTQSNARSRT